MFQNVKRGGLIDGKGLTFPGFKAKKHPLKPEKPDKIKDSTRRVGSVIYVCD